MFAVIRTNLQANKCPDSPTDVQAYTSPLHQSEQSAIRSAYAGTFTESNQTDSHAYQTAHCKPLRGSDLHAHGIAHLRTDCATNEIPDEVSFPDADCDSDRAVRDPDCDADSQTKRVPYISAHCIAHRSAVFRSNDFPDRDAFANPNRSSDCANANAHDDPINNTDSEAYFFDSNCFAVKSDAGSDCCAVSSAAYDASNVSRYI
jgi:hypothetical protein